MPIDPIRPPLLTPEIAGVGGRIKVRAEDFEVEEVPSYEPSGTGDHLYLWVQKTGVGAPTLQRHVERANRQVTVVDGADGPAHDESREQVEHGGEVELAAATDDELRRVADPALIRARRVKATGQQIRSDWQLKSAYFSIAELKDSILISGRGYGHGVGMCQEGGIRMAKCGFPYEYIINFYYKNVEVVHLSRLDFFREE